VILSCINVPIYYFLTLTFISFLDDLFVQCNKMEVNISTNIDSLEHFIPVNTFSMTIL